MSAALLIADVSKAFTTKGNGRRVALSNISLTVRRGEFMMIVGHNGSGKTTLLNVISGDLQADSGTVEFDASGEPFSVHALGSKERSKLVGRVFQNPIDGVFGGLRVWENLHVALMKSVPLPFRFASRTRIEARLRNELRAGGLIPHLDSTADALSGGERQLLALEMAILRRPEVLLLDEHTSSLDARNARSCMERTVELAKQQDITTIAVTHDLSQAIEFGQRLIVLREGQIAADINAASKSSITVADLTQLCGFGPRLELAQ